MWRSLTALSRGRESTAWSRRWSGWLWWQSRSHRWRNACDFSGLLSNCRVLAELRRRSACFETGHGNFARNVVAKSADNLAGYSRCRVNDNFILHYPGPAPAIRSQLSLPIPGVECDHYHRDGSSHSEGEGNAAAHDRDHPDCGWHCAGFTQLGLHAAKNL